MSTLGEQSCSAGGDAARYYHGSDTAWMGVVRTIPIHGTGLRSKLLLAPCRRGMEWYLDEANYREQGMNWYLDVANYGTIAPAADERASGCAREW